MIELRSVQKVYPCATTPYRALHDIDLIIGTGEFVAVVGPAGSGKSTLLTLIGCLDLPTSGHVFFNGGDTTRLSDDQLARLRNGSIGFVFRTRNLIPELTVRGNVELPSVYAGAGAHRRDRSTKLLADLGLAARAEHPAATLSRGDQQRVALARALANDPELIVADEPTGSIDGESAEQFLHTLREQHLQGRTIVLATDNEGVAAVAERVVRLAAGLIAVAAKPVGSPVNVAHPVATSCEVGA